MSKRKLQLLQALNHENSGLMWNHSSASSSMPFTIAGMNTTALSSSSSDVETSSSTKGSTLKSSTTATNEDSCNSFVVPMLQQQQQKRLKSNHHVTEKLSGKDFYQVQEEMECQYQEEKKEKEEIEKENKAFNEKLEKKEALKNVFKSEPNYVKLNLRRKTFKSKRRFKGSSKKYGNALSKKDLELLKDQDNNNIDDENEIIGDDSENDDETNDTTPSESSLSLGYSLEDILNSKQVAEIVLKEHFSHDSFRSGQYETISRILRKESALLISVTGSGKSTCYQYPALCLTCTKKEFVIVVSPLISLMEDQMQNLIPSLRGALMTNHQSSQQRSKIMNDIRKGLVKILFISPERLCDARFIESAKQLPPISFACIDEAHCMSEWSHNFRPSYLSVKNVLEKDLGVSTILALTGTATKSTEQSICDYLHIPAENVSRQTLARHNLVKTVSLGLPSKFTAVLNLLNSDRMKGYRDSVIIYTMLRKDAEQLCSHLIMNGIHAIPYHAGIEASRRKEIQTQFMNKEINIIVATVAFGMGISISGVQSVIHFNLPRSIESYVQEIGRAGRDGSPAQCHIFFDEDDYVISRSLCYSNYVDIFTVKKLIQKIFSKNAEKGHMCVLGMKQLEKHLDLKEEVISTLLTILHNKGFIKLLSNTNHIYTIFFMKTTPAELAKKHSWLKTAMSNSKATSKFEIDIAKIAVESSISFSQLETEIIGLKEIGEIKYEAKSEAYRMELLQNVTNVIELSTIITDEMRLLEKVNVSKVQAMFKLAREFVVSDEEAQKTNPTKKLGMERLIDEYFTCENEQDFLKDEADVVKTELKGNDRSVIHSDCCVLLRKYDTIPNAKVLTKILTGMLIFIHC
ncbi:hypothetical protein C9374_008870 [Naegleria lovaniensis]|uniref:DNA 3'-5' helicase n=1 Tax=Naegleria lovaniensis TaxID=51637 RepID=A0AA88KFG6_NAELO|nr:uncharacterized protein C9374_008870 [Naegleria lovaniensis]KAG2377785.1 hypothetical protein C9374_008870 [Naegleria lovaniensis]